MKWIFVVIAVIAGISTLFFAYMRWYSNRRVAVLDDHGLCWIGQGRSTLTGARIYSNGGELAFYRPAVVFSHHGHVSEAALSSILRVDASHCLRILKSK